VEKEKCRFEEEQNEKLFPKYSYLYQYFISSRQELLSVPNKMHL
jgi:hypothetical protein